LLRSDGSKSQADANTITQARRIQAAAFWCPSALILVDGMYQRYHEGE